MITGLGGRNRRLARVLAGAALVAAGCWAAPGDVLAQPVVQSVPDGGSRMLNAALARLARDPRDLAALIDAGNAALQMGDVDAAVGFFSRADQLSPNNMRVKAGLAGALVRSENPYDAIPLFTEAERAGAMDAMLLSDRGLAYDLVGDNTTAQRYYRQSLVAGANDETSRRLALSQAMAGDRAGMEATLSPLLQRQDKSAWRTRAFSLAILGRADDAIAIANQTMPAGLASGIAPYLRYMPRLTPAQQAAAANFGRFPRAAEIGHDDPRVALYAPPKRVASADAALVPAGEPLGRQRSRRDGRKGEAATSGSRTPPVLASAAPIAPALVRSAPPEPMPVRQTVAAPAPARIRSQPPSPSVAPAPAPASAPARASQAGNATLASASGFDLSRVGATQPAAAATPPPRPAGVPAPTAAAAVPASVAPATATPAPAPVPRPTPTRPRRVADAFADLSLPSGPAAPAPGAVDIRKIAAAKAKAEAAKVPPKPAHPSRIWVQVGTGRDIKALGFTWRGLAKDNPELFRSRDPFLSDWGRTNRLLTGPFPTESAAQAFLAKLKKNDIDAFLWTSPAGQVVDELDAR